MDVKLARIEERLDSLLQKFEGFEDVVSKFATKDELNQAEFRIEKTIKGFVSKEEFGPVKLISFGLVGLILVAVITAMLSTVIIG